MTLLMMFFSGKPFLLSSTPISPKNLKPSKSRQLNERRARASGLLS